MEDPLSSFRFPRPALLSPAGERAGGASAGAGFGNTEFAKCFATTDMVEGVIMRRLIAYVIDIVLLFGVTTVLWILSFGWLTPLLAFLPIAYHTLLIGGPDSSTIGMSLMGLEVRRWDGGRPGVLQAFVMTVLFYITLAGPQVLLLAFSLFNSLGRTLHDLLSGTVVVNRQEVPETS